jgi:(2S)-methylsuccinyl-CoA dehydrogenase
MDAPVVDTDTLILPDLVNTCLDAYNAVQHLQVEARKEVSRRVVHNGRIVSDLLDQEQFAAHGYAWLCTYAQALRAMVAWAERLDGDGALGELESLYLQAAYGEYLSQIVGGIAMSQVEVVRPSDLGISDDAIHAFYTPAVVTLMRHGNTSAVRMRIARLIADHQFGNFGLDETLEMIRDQFHRWT